MKLKLNLYSTNKYIVGVRTRKDRDSIVQISEVFRTKKEAEKFIDEYPEDGDMYGFWDKFEVFDLREIPLTKLNSNSPDYSGCLMIQFKISNWDEVLNKLDPKDVVEYEQEPHLTILYGLDKNQKDYENRISEFMRKVDNDLRGKKFDILNLNYFEGEDNDILKFEVYKSSLLMSINSIIKSEFEYSNKFPDYEPHVTIAYLKKGTGSKYKKDLPEGFELNYQGLKLS